MTQPALPKIHVASIVAVADNGVIGKTGAHLGMPWHIPSEFAYFKKTTLGHPVIHGRKSFAALGNKPLPKRPNIVVTRDKSFTGHGFDVAHTIEEAIDIARLRAAGLNVDTVFVCGGAEIYRQAMDLIDRLYYTEIHMQPEGDVTFPDFNRSEWREIRREFHKAQDGESADYSITVLERAA